MALAGVAVAPGQALASPLATITVYPVPTDGAGLARIATGPDGNVWFAESDANQIGRITPDGVITEFPIPTPGSGPHGIVGGPDGNVWFTELNTETVASITPGGVITEYDVSPPFPCYPSCRTSNITLGADGNLWFTQPSNSEYGGGWLGRISPAGIVTHWEAETPEDITPGPDGNLWFTADGYHSNEIGKITTDGTITYYPYFDCFLYEFCSPSGIAAGLDGALWFTTRYTNYAVRITTDGTFGGLFSIPFEGGYIKSGPGGNLWLAPWEHDGGASLATVRLTGGVRGYRPLPGGEPTDLTVGPDRQSLWVSTSAGNAIVKLTSP